MLSSYLKSLFIRILIPIFLLGAITVQKSYGQKAIPSMDEGFALLENGKFSRAVGFFENILQTNPENQTARLCYGRAVGLSGNVTKAEQIFEQLVLESPENIEFQLNRTESLMWQGEFEQAAQRYTEILNKREPTFEILLGYANAMSALKQYDQADSLVRKALEMRPQDAGAHNTLKYIGIGAAYGQMQKNQLDSAEARLQQLAVDYPQETEIRILQADLALRQKQPEEAQQFYESLLKGKDSLKAMMGLALTWQMRKRPARALQQAKRAWDLSGQDGLKDVPQSDLSVQIQTRYIQALIWNRKFNKAEALIEQLVKADHPQAVRSLRMMLYLYQGLFDNAREHAENWLEKEPQSFEAKMGRIQALIGKGSYRQAQLAARQVQLDHNNHKDAEALEKRAAENLKSNIESASGWSQDNGGNQASFYRISGKFPLGDAVEVNGVYTLRETQNDFTGILAETQSAAAGLTWKPVPDYQLGANVGVIRANSDAFERNQPNVSFSLKANPFAGHTFNLQYSHALEDFNAALIREGLTLDRITASYHWFLPKGIGTYLQATQTSIGDGNKSQQYFASLYFLPLASSSLKTGVNYQQLSFEIQRSDVYFSPQNYFSLEGFAAYSPKIGELWKIDLMAAYGTQGIEDNPLQMTFRGQASLGRKISERWNLGVYGNYSSQAAATFAGFQYQEGGIQLQASF